MRVLPGMQSAFVDIGLERDAFLYVSDFFDEEEEIEKIVLEKGKKGSHAEASREVNERIDRSRIEREKQMDSAQELSEPLAESGEPIAEEAAPEKASGRSDRGKRSRGRKDRERKEELKSVAEPIEVEFDAGGFERIADDDEGDTGDAFKDAYRQEAIVARVRAVEFDEGESTGIAEVGSLLAEVSNTGDFERIADEEDAPKEEAPKKGRRTKAAAEKKPAKAKAAKVKAPKKPSARGKKKAAAETAEAEAAAAEEPLADAEAFERVADDTAPMAVRRGGRGRRRGGRSKKANENGNSTENGVEVSDEHDEQAGTDNDTFRAELDETVESNGNGNIQTEEISTPSEDNEDEKPDEKPAREERGRGRRGRGRGDREDRKESDDSEKKGRNDRGGRHGRERGPQPTISDLLREGQEILVQIAKEPIAKKGARITSHIALPGRYLVYMPTIEHLGVSRKIESSAERGRLRTLIQKIRQDDAIRQGGFIVRTAGIGIGEEDLRNDAIYLARTWQDAKKASEKKKSPALIHQDLDLVQRLLRDQLSDEFTAIRVDSEEEYLRTVEFMNRMAPRMVNRVKLYTRDEPILDAYGVQEEIDKALKPRVWLRSGGYLVINQTEALVAIDVNTGKFVGKGNARLEDTITKTNLEAVDEIARQIRLRDLGGIIVLDLIDMEDRRNRHKVSQALQEALSHDKSPTKVLSFNDFGLIIMTRKRVKQSLERTMCAPCEYCEGAGWVKSPQTVCYEILGEARRLARQVDDIRHTTLRVHPEVATALRNSERQVMEEIEAHLGSVDLSSDKTVHQAQFDFAFV
ncbi:MAG: Rne/Rng family ribonuclease [Acidobacteria bacterium ACB1]|nr:Rne/Rng family ribonuclease [Acidobacteria bacterium ACB1]